MKSENIQCDHCERVKLFNRKLLFNNTETTYKCIDEEKRTGRDMADTGHWKQDPQAADTH